jgi:histone deacetylase 8
VEPEPASRDQLCYFHDTRYVGEYPIIRDSHNISGTLSWETDFLLNTKKDPSLGQQMKEDPDGSGESETSDDEDGPRTKRQKVETFGLQDDCPWFAELEDYVREIAGASIQAARELRDGRADVAIAWTGGRYALHFFVNGLNTRKLFGS